MGRRKERSENGVVSGTEMGQKGTSVSYDNKRSGKCVGQNKGPFFFRLSYLLTVSGKDWGQ